MTVIETLKCATCEQLLVTVRKLSPPLVPKRVDVPPPRNVTQPLPERLADRVCPYRHARTSERLSPGFTSPPKDVVNAPRENFNLVVAG